MAVFTFAPLTPTAFLDRSASVFRDRLAVVDGDRRFSYLELADRCRRLTGVLAGLDVGPGERVAALCTNSAEMLELHHGVPMRGAVLVPLNTRLSVPELSYCVKHSGATVLVATADLATAAQEVATATGVRLLLAGAEYEQLLAAAEPSPIPTTDERDLISISYTSGTTGPPKGVMYHHRGAYLQALAMAFHTGLGSESRYLWTLPMFHCNGWCFTWAVVAAGGTAVCLPAIAPAEIWRLVRDEGITHLSGAPTVLSMIAYAPEAKGTPPAQTVRVQTGGAPPSPTLLAAMAELNMDVTHLYGLTETYGPLALNEWQPQWRDLPASDQAKLKARQGVGNVVAEPVRVVDEYGHDVPADVETVGEIVARGNNVMLGYYLDDEATEAATIDGWFRTGDLAVMHPDGYVEIRDRSKDIIISGGENIASVEVEQALDSHPAVLESAVVAASHEHWGQVPIAFVTLRDGAEATAEELIGYVKGRIARFKAPHQVRFGPLPKTSTGKVQKGELRKQDVSADPH